MTDEPIDSGCVRVRFALVEVKNNTDRKLVCEALETWPGVLMPGSFAYLHLAPLGFLTDLTVDQRSIK